MTDRKSLLDAVLGNIRTWTIGPEGISAEPGKDTEALIQAITAQPGLLGAAHSRGPSPEDLRRTMQQVIDGKLAELQALRAEQPTVSPKLDGPENPLRFTEAVNVYLAAVDFAERTVVDKKRLLSVSTA